MKAAYLMVGTRGTHVEARESRGKRLISAQNAYVVAVLAACTLVVCYLLWSQEPAVELPGQVRGPQALAKIPFDGAAAYQHLVGLCKLGSRRSGSEGMLKQQQLLIEHFEKQGRKVERQEFQVRHPLDGSLVPMVNLVVHWHPDRRERVLVAAHYDTRPYPDRDARDPQGLFVGANDGASGVAVLMELGRWMPELDGAIGVDFVLFDGEELVFAETGEYFLGAKHFAQEYVAQPPPYRYRAGVLLDMVGDTQLRLLMEPTSVRLAPTVTHGVWETARWLGVREFIPQVMATAVNDDHVPLNEIAGIPTCDVIDFDYPYWHTKADDPSHCSALSLARVGWVVQEWLKSVVAGRRTLPPARSTK